MASTATSAPAREVKTSRNDREEATKTDVQVKKAAMSTRDTLVAILPAAAGSFIEFYEFGIFTYMSKYITGNFFADGHGGSVATWAGFAITFAFRPIGGAVFGWMGDRFGRKPVMQLTILLMLTTTVAQGCLPTFHCCGEAWGWVGMVLLLVCRLFQGMSAGGELSTAAVYISEVSPSKSLGFNLAWLSVTGAFGAWCVAAFVVFLCETIFGKVAMMEWGWRVPYLTTVIPGLCVIVARQYLSETADFEDLLKAEAEKLAASAAETGDKAKAVTAELSPLRELMANHKLALLVGSLGIAGYGALSFVPPVYGVQFIEEYDGLPGPAITFSELVSYLVPTLMAVPVGYWVDAWGVGKVYGLAMLFGCIIATPPLMYWWTHVPEDQAVAAVFIGEIILGFGLSLCTASYLWLVELFPVRVRVTGVSISYNIGIGLFGGFGPLISDAGNKIISPRAPIDAPAAVTLFCGVLSVLAVFGSRELGRRGLLRITHIRETPY